MLGLVPSIHVFDAVSSSTKEGVDGRHGAGHDDSDPEKIPSRPKADDLRPGAEDDSIQGPLGTDMKTVLLVDDDPVFSLLVREFLESAGYAVIAVGDTLKALDELESDRTINLAVIDIFMPEGLPNGVSLAAMARLRRRGLPIIIVTGSPELVGPHVASDQTVLHKPIDLDTLLGAVRAKLGTSAAPA
jgi:CheY-like chemotaxis protein